MKKELEIYIHIPFCVKKCAYCDFLSGPQDRDTIENYVDKLVKEIGVQKPATVSSIFLGGGTPSVLDANQVTRIFDALRENFDIAEDAEITIEANPGTVTAEKLQAYKQCM